MRILSVAPHLPYEGVRHAGGQYLLRHLQRLSAQHDVTVVVPETEDPLVRGAEPPDDLQLVVPPLRLAERGPGRVLADAAYRRLMGVPPAPTRQSLRAVRAAGLVERAAAADVVELHWAEYARFAVELRRAGVRTPIAVVEHDVDVEAYRDRVRRQLAGYRKPLALATAPLAVRAEVAGLRAADLVLVFKPSDEQVLRRAGVRTPVQVIDPWLEDPTTDALREPATALFTGAMWRQENADGARWFVEQVWPRVLGAVPGARLVLAGAAPTDGLREAVGRAASVELTGDVPDLLPYYGRASVFVAPLFAGGGLKFKVAQAMRCGLPAVLTANAAQGVVEHAPAEALWAVTDDPVAQAEAVVRAFRDEAAARRCGTAAAAWAAEHWSFDRAVDALVDRYAHLAAAR